MTKLVEKLAAMCRDHGVASLYAFGSRAREIAAVMVSGGSEGSPVSGSDVDLAVQPRRGALSSARERVRLAERLEDLLRVPRVDLVILPEASAFLALDAVRGELLYADDETRQAREELYYLRRAGDLAPLQRERLNGLLHGELRR
jgi:predicted nucleotidyltransferase